MMDNIDLHKAIARKRSQQKSLRQSGKNVLPSEIPSSATYLPQP